MTDPLRRHLLMLHRPNHKRGAWHWPPLRVRLAVRGLERVRAGGVHGCQRSYRTTTGAER